MKAEEVIKGLECCIADPATPEDCKHLGCPYSKYSDQTPEGESLCCVTLLMHDALQFIDAALELLKKEEPVEPVEDKNLIYGGWFGREAECCGNCGNNLRLTAMYCDRCGRKIKRPEFDPNRRQKKSTGGDC